MIPFYCHRPDVPPPPYQGTIQYRTKEGSDCEIDAARFFQLTGSCYVTISFPSKDFTEKHSYGGHFLVSAVFSGASDKNLRLIHLLGDKAPVGLSVVAAKALKRSENICHYPGQHLAAYELNSPFAVGAIDALQFRGLGAMVNHSFPNAELQFHSYSGIEEVVVVATDDIAEGEEVCIDYGDTYSAVSLGCHIELRYEALKTFVKRPDMYQHQEKLAYLAASPASLLRLYFLRDWSWKQLNEFLCDVPFCIEVPSYFETVKKLLQGALPVLDSHFRELGSDALYTEIRDYFIAAIETKSIVGALYALKAFRDELPERPLCQEDWLEIRNTLDMIVVQGNQLLKNILKM
ncbi:MAG: SET domain-containing protein [Verrucomicrobia bacterium]|nr:SET domain-containing protein [Verrucomicrobiota bacterium]